MKILVDTNVWIAGLIARGLSSEVLDHCLCRRSVWSSEFILGELEEKLRVKFGLSAVAVAQAVGFARRQCSLADDSKAAIPEICRDSSDNRVLAAAASIPADILLTGDSDLLVLKDYGGAKIMNPRDFWREEGLRPR